MIRGLLYAVECDACGERFKLQDSNSFRVRDWAESAGWKFRRRKDGKIAKSGGKDYCPRCAGPDWGKGR